METLAGFRALCAFVRTAKAPRAGASVRSCAMAAVLALAACEPAAPTSGDAPAVSPASSVSNTVAPVPTPASLGGFEIVDPPNPSLPWDFDLGVVTFGDIAEVVIRLKNQDGRPLTVDQIQVPCSCTTATISYVDEKGERVHGEPASTPLIVVPDGVVAELKVVTDTRLVPVQNTAKRMRIVVLTDSKTNPFLAAEVHLIVELAFQAVPGTLRLGDVAETEGARASAKIVSLGVDGKKLTGIESSSHGVTATVSFDEGVVPDQWTLNVELAAPVERGPIDGYVEIGTTGPRGEGRGKPVRVPIVGTGVPDIELRPERLIFVGLAANTAAEVQLFGHLAGQRLRVLGVQPDAAADGLIVATAEPLAADDSGKSPQWRIRARLAKDAPNELVGVLKLETDELGTLELPYAIAAKR
ncbi:MAG: DUF1573 domain-containing protein [Planctomycetes bacterium]|nr:DUF1573 domain-containing protein [Planctomycetota bacterium]